MNNRSLLFAVLLLTVILSSLSQPFQLQAANLVLVAGGGENTADGINATEAKLSAPFGVDFDRAGNMYLVEMTGYRLLLPASQFANLRSNPATVESSKNKIAAVGSQRLSRVTRVTDLRR